MNYYPIAIVKGRTCATCARNVSTRYCSSFWQVSVPLQHPQRRSCLIISPGHIIPRHGLVQNSTGQFLFPYDIRFRDMIYKYACKKFIIQTANKCPSSPLLSSLVLFPPPPSSHPLRLAHKRLGNSIVHYNLEKKHRHRGGK